VDSPRKVHFFPVVHLWENSLGILRYIILGENITGGKRKRGNMKEKEERHMLKRKLRLKG
jgi:hypothetical protein